MSVKTRKPKPKPTEAPRPKAPAPIPPGCESLLGLSQICAALAISRRTLQSMLSAGEYPPADVRLGRFPRWLVRTHNAWVESRVGKGA